MAALNGRSSLLHLNWMRHSGCMNWIFSITADIAHQKFHWAYFVGVEKPSACPASQLGSPELLVGRLEGSNAHGTWRLCYVTRVLPGYQSLLLLPAPTHSSDCPFSSGRLNCASLGYISRDWETKRTWPFPERPRTKPVKTTFPARFSLSRIYGRMVATTSPAFISDLYCCLHWDSQINSAVTSFQFLSAAQQSELIGKTLTLWKLCSFWTRTKPNLISVS